MKIKRFRHELYCCSKFCLFQKISAALSFVSGTAALFFIAALSSVFLFVSCASSKVDVSYMYPEDVGMWKHIYSKSEPFVVPAAFPDAIIIPHHDICSEQQNSFYSAISKYGKPSLIVLIGPDHFEGGEKEMALPGNVNFNAPPEHYNENECTIPLAVNLINLLKKDPYLKDFVSVQDEMWKADHAVWVHTPFLNHYFPEVPVMPVLLKKNFGADSDFTEYKKLAEFLNNNLPEDALVIGSVDFSHYQIPLFTEMHDMVTMNTIANYEFTNHIEVDSPESVTVVMEYCRLRNAANPVLIHRTSSYDFLPEEIQPSTSHQYWAFYADKFKPLFASYYGKVKNSSQRWQTADYENTLNQTIMFLGNGNVGGGVREFWHWDRYRNSSDKADKLLHELAGVEGRFLIGYDELVMDMKDGESFESTKHKTSVKINCIDADDENFSVKIPDTLKDDKTIYILEVNVKYSGFNSDSLKEKMILSGWNVAVIHNEVEPEKSKLIAAPDVRCNAADFQEYYLGELYNEEGKNIEGNVVVLDWHDGILRCRQNGYTSENGIAPKVMQLAPEEF